MTYKHIIWDFDGTLFDTYPAFSGVYADVLKERGITEPQDEILSFMKVSIGYAKRHYQEKHNLDSSFSDRYEALLEEAQRVSSVPYEGIIKLCSDICKNGGWNYIYTHRGESVHFYLEKFGLADCFREVVTSEYAFPRKPAPEAISYLLNKYNIPPAEALMIGDRDIDVLSGINAGIHGCFFTEGKSQNYDGASHKIDYLSELYKICGVESI